MQTIDVEVPASPRSLTEERRHEYYERVTKAMTACAASCRAEMDDLSLWKSEGTKKKIEVYSREDPVCPEIPVYLATVPMDDSWSDPYLVAALIMQMTAEENLEKRKKWDPLGLEYVVMERIHPTRCAVVYSRADKVLGGIISPRDFVYARYVTDTFHFISSLSGQFDHYRQKHPSAVRGRVNRICIDVDVENRRLRYCLHLNPNGYIPKWAIRKTLFGIVTEFMETLVKFVSQNLESFARDRLRMDSSCSVTSSSDEATELEQSDCRGSSVDDDSSSPDTPDGIVPNHELAV